MGRQFQAQKPETWAVGVEASWQNHPRGMIGASTQPTLPSTNANADLVLAIRREMMDSVRQRVPYTLSSSSIISLHRSLIRRVGCLTILAEMHICPGTATEASKGCICTPSERNQGIQNLGDPRSSYAHWCRYKNTPQHLSLSKIC